MRIRTIKPEFFKNEDLAALPPLTRLLFVGLWTMADRRGRLEDRPKRIKAELLPYDNCDAEAMLASLNSGGFIHRYKAAGKAVIWIPTFEKHQRISGKEADTDSVLPAPPTSTDECSVSSSQRAAYDCEITREAPRKHLGSTSESPGKHPGAQEGNGKEWKGNNTPLPPQPLQAVPPQTSDDTRGGDVVSSEEPKAGKAEEFTGMFSGSFSGSSSSAPPTQAQPPVQAALPLGLLQPAPQPPTPPEPTRPNRKEIEREFFRQAEAIFAEYPKKVDKGRAIKAIIKLLREGTATFEKLLAKTKEYAAAVSKWDPDAAATYTPYPATWFNGHRFDDDPKTWVRREIMSPIRQMLALDAEIKKHKANPESVYCNRMEVTQELKDELLAMRRKYNELNRIVAGVAGIPKGGAR